MFDKCLTVDEWINLVNSSNAITKGKARLNRNSMLNGRDRHQQTLTAQKVDSPLLAHRPAWGGGGTVSFKGCPQGTVSFITNGWGGRVSDKYITEHSGFLNKLR